MDKKIAVLGCGATGCVTAAWLTKRGFEVTLCDLENHSSDFKEIREQGGILIEGNVDFSSPVMPHLLTNDFEKTLQENRRVIVCCAASRHDALAEACRPYLTSDHSILITPGNLGAVIFREAAVAETAIGEVSGNLWACRRLSSGRFVTALPLGKIFVAAYPSCDNDKLIKTFEDIFDMEKGLNIVETTLNSPNVASHLPGTILNAVAIEKIKDFCLFMDGLSPVLIDCIEFVENELDAVLEKAGLRRYKGHSRTLMNMLLENEKHPEFEVFRSLDGPSSLSHRYLTEDAECGVALLVSMAKKLEVDVKNTEAFLQLAGALVGADYQKTGRTIEWLNRDVEKFC